MDLYITHFLDIRWINIRMNLLAAAFSSGLAAYLTYVKSTTAANTGFSLNMAGMSSALRALGVNETSLISYLSWIQWLNTLVD